MHPPALTAARVRGPAISRKLHAWAKRNTRSFPWRAARSPYSVLLSEVLLRRTTSTAAASVYSDFLTTFPSVYALARADTLTLQLMLKRIGLQIQRAQALTEMAQYIVEHFDGTIPEFREDLENIPNVGNYTAAAVRSFGFGVRDAVVDSNVMRILRRLFAKSIGRKKLSFTAYEELALVLLPQEHQTHNFAVLDLGALVCRYDYPRCRACPLNRLCDTGLRTTSS